MLNFWQFFEIFFDKFLTIEYIMFIIVTAADKKSIWKPIQLIEKESSGR